MITTITALAVPLISGLVFLAYYDKENYKRVTIVLQVVTNLAFWVTLAFDTGLQFGQRSACKAFENNSECRKLANADFAPILTNEIVFVFVVFVIISAALPYIFQDPPGKA